MFGWVAAPFDLRSTLLTALIAAYVVVVMPFNGRRQFHRLVSRRWSNAAALGRFYLRAIVGLWLLTGLVLTVVAVGPAIAPANLGLVIPTGGEAVLTAALTGYVLVLLAAAARSTRRRLAQGGTLTGRERLAALLPTTPVERRLAFGLAITAGISEELLHRGLFITAGVSLLRLSPALAAGLSVVAFATAHLYQGRPGILGAGLIGVLLTALYAVTGSLLAPMVCHALNDIVAFLVIPAPAREATAGEAPVT